MFVGEVLPTVVIHLTFCGSTDAWSEANVASTSRWMTCVIGARIFTRDSTAIIGGRQVRRKVADYQEACHMAGELAQTPASTGRI
jgi:hypothetical protein